MNAEMKQPSLGYLFRVFLKIGTFSVGGFMGMIAVVRAQLVDKDKVVDDGTVLDGITLSSILPGPLAVNTVTYIGFALRGFWGGVVSLIGVLLPSFSLMCVLAYFYLRYGSLPSVNLFFLGAVPAICAVILNVALNMAKDAAKKFLQYLILVLACISFLFVHGALATFTVIFCGGLIGRYAFYQASEDLTPFKFDFKFKREHLKYLAYAILPKFFTFTVLYLFSTQYPWLKQTVDLFIGFAKLSLGMFGGGYVAIPSIHAMVVDHHHWLSSKEFADAITLGQITPGPILISSAFFGFKVLGLLGALAATSGMYFPPAVFIMIGSIFLNYFKNSMKMKSIILGVRPAVVGLILSAIYAVGKSVQICPLTIAIFLLAFAAQYRFKTNALLLVPVAGLISLLFGYFGLV